MKELIKKEADEDYSQSYSKEMLKSIDKLDKLFKFLFQIFDENNDGKLNFSEFIMGMSLSIIDSPTENDKNKLYDKLFEILDKDNTKTISKKELKKLYKALLATLTKDKEELSLSAALVIKENFDKYDSSKTGNMNKEDFIKMCKSDNIFDALIF